MDHCVISGSGISLVRTKLLENKEITLFSNRNKKPAEWIISHICPGSVPIYHTVALKPLTFKSLSAICVKHCVRRTFERGGEKKTLWPLTSLMLHFESEHNQLVNKGRWFYNWEEELEFLQLLEVKPHVVSNTLKITERTWIISSLTEVRAKKVSLQVETPPAKDSWP